LQIWFDFDWWCRVSFFVFVGRDDDDEWWMVLLMDGVGDSCDGDGVGDSDGGDDYGDGGDPYCILLFELLWLLWLLVVVSFVWWFGWLCLSWLLAAVGCGCLMAGCECDLPTVNTRPFFACMHPLKIYVELISSQSAFYLE
jgi:hypothetical protein